MRSVYTYLLAFQLVLLGVFPVVGLAGDLPAGGGGIGETEATDRVQELRDRMAEIDAQMAAFDEEEKALGVQMRTAHKEQYLLREEIRGNDEEVQQLMQKIELQQRNLNALQIELETRISAQPEYVEISDQQASAVQRLEVIRNQKMGLANTRVQIQLELDKAEEQSPGSSAEEMPDQGTDTAPITEDTK